MSIESRNNTLHIRLQVCGQKIRKSTGLPDTGANRKKAKAIEAQMLEDLNLQARFGVRPIKPMGFREAADQFIEWLKTEHATKPRTQYEYSNIMLKLKEHIPDVPISSLTAGDVENVKVWRTQQGCKPATVKLTLITLSKFFKFAIKHNWCAVNLCSLVKFPSDKDSRRTRIISRAEEERYFRTALDLGLVDLYDHCRLILLLGLRPQEVRFMRKADINWDRLELTVTKCKTPAAHRVLNLNGEAASILTKRMEGSSEWIFPNLCGKEGPWHPMTALTSHWRVCEAIGLKFEPYCLRHTFGTRLAELGTDLPTLAALLGHSGLGYVQRYIHITAEHKKKAMKAYELSFHSSDLTAMPIPA